MFIGTPDITNLSKLYSGNEYLQRRFVVTDKEGNVLPKPTLAFIHEDTHRIAYKKLTAATKLTKVDELTMPIYEAFLGLTLPNDLNSVLNDAGVDVPDRETLYNAIRKNLPHDERVVIFKRIGGLVDRAIENLYRTHILPVVFYIGSSGLLPDSMNSKAMTPDEVSTAHPGIKLDKKERDNGVFYDLPGGLLLTLTLTSEAFSVTPPSAEDPE